MTECVEDTKKNLDGTTSKDAKGEKGNDNANTVESRYNIGESKVVAKLIFDLIESNITPEMIGVITPYRGQVKVIKEEIKNMEYSNVEISTVDSFQGREKEIIILSMVRCNAKHEVGFLKELKRLNVAVSRAKRLLIAVGDSITLQKGDLYLGKFVNWFRG